MSDILSSHYDKQKRHEQVLFKELKRSWREVEKGLMDEVNRVLEDIDKNPNKLLEYRRVNQLLHQVQDEIQKYADDVVRPVVARGMVQSSFLGSEQASDVLRNTTGVVRSINLLPVKTIEEFTTFLTTGPLGKLLDGFGADAANKARKDILTSLALGHNPRKTARVLRKTLNISQRRALLIARTETLRAHREGNRQTYQRNPHLVTAWIWHAAASERTCAACWALHGQEFPLEEKMGAHPACRCTMVPKTKTWREMGYQIDGDEVVPQGEDLFAQQSDETQKKVLGSQYDRYKRGEITLNDFVSVRNSEWGTTYTRKVPK